MGNNNKTLIGYTIAVFISLFAYETYSEFLSDYNSGFALAAFEFISFLTLRFLYPAFEKRALRGLEVKDDGFRITTGAALKKRPLVLALLGLINYGQFAIMLPLLSTPKNAMLFVLFYSISSVAKIPLAQKIFGDKIGNPLFYNVGLIIIILAGIAIQINGTIENGHFNVSYLLLCTLIIKAGLNIMDSILERRITSPEYAGAKRLSVASVEETKTYFTVTAGLLTGVYYYFTNIHFQRVLPTLTELGAIVFIGVICSVMATLGVRLINVISHIKSQPIQAIRPMIAFLPILFEYSQTGNNGYEVLYQSICLTITAIGILICLRSVSPVSKIDNQLQHSI